MNHLNTIDDLQDIFFEDKKYLWRLYSGRTAKGAIIGFNKDDDDPESSWDKLASRIMMYGSGFFSVAVMEKYATNNTQATIHVLKLGTGNSPQDNRMSGGFGSNLSDTLMLMRFMDERSNRNQPTIDGIADEITERLSLKFENEKLREEIKQLKKGGTTTRIAEIALTKIPNILEHYFPGQRGIAGEMGYHNGPDRKEEEHGQTEKENAPGSEYSDTVDFNVIVNAASIMNREIPEANVNELMACLCKLAISMKKANPDRPVLEIIQKLQQFIESQPEMALMALGNLG